MSSYKSFVINTALLDPAAHAIGDTLFAPVAVNALSKGFRRENSRAVLRSLTYAISNAIDILPVIYLFSGLVTVGAANAPFNLQYADTAKIIGRLNNTSSVLPVGAGRMWSFPANNDVLNLPLRADNQNTIYFAGATTGTPTPGTECASRLIAVVEYLD